MSLILYDYWRSSASYRVRIALALKGVPYQRVAVNLLTAEQLGPENRARNPQGQVPVLVADGVPLIQSLAIIDWLDHAYPEPRLIPADPLARARALALALVIAADTHPVDNMRVLKRLETQFGADQAAKDDWYRHWMRLGLDALEAMADNGAGEGRYLGGDSPGVADVVLVPQLYNARRFALDLAPCPKLVAIDAALAQLPAFQAAHPDRVKPE